jgi:transposase
LLRLLTAGNGMARPCSAIYLLSRVGRRKAIPKQESTGDRTILGKISKRGNKYVRTLFVQAAHVVLERRPRTARQGLWPWIEQASKRLHRNMLAIALANKLARIAWAVLARGHAYQPRIIANA